MAEAVSYTHLDVYKRQHQMRAEYKKQALLGDVFHPGVKKEEGKVVVSLSNESGEPYAVVEFTE